MVVAGRDRLVIILLIVVQIGLLVFFAFNRLTDGDEGFYLSAGQAAGEGKMVYRDFFYPQMPYLPYLFALFSGHGMATLFQTRVASVMAAILTTLLFYAALRRTVSDNGVIAILLTMYVFSGLVVSWHSVAKTFAWSDLFLMASFYSLIKYLAGPKLFLALLAGALVALAVNIRLVLVPVAAVFLLSVIAGTGRRRIGAVLVGMIGGLIVSGPAIYLFVTEPKRFLFDNLGFHLMRDPGLTIPLSALQKLEVIGKMLVNPQILLLFILALAAFIAWRKSQINLRWWTLVASPAGLAGVTALILTLIYLTPSPVHQHYFVQAVPFLLLASPGGVGILRGSNSRWLRFMSGRRLIDWGLVVYILAFLPYLVIFVGAVRPSDKDLSLANMKQICAHINTTYTSGPILSEQPIVPVLANRPFWPGTEFLGFEYPLPLSRAEKEFYRLATSEELQVAIEGGGPECLVVVDHPDPPLAAAFDVAYEPDRAFGRMIVYRRK